LVTSKATDEEVIDFLVQDKAARVIQKCWRRSVIREKLMSLVWKVIWNRLDLEEGLIDKRVILLILHFRKRGSRARRAIREVS
jgi:hypothetical protein